MKKVFLILALLGLITSCSLDDDRVQINYELQPVVDYELPDTLVWGQRYNFKIRYVSPTSCNYFYDFDYARQDSTRLIYVFEGVYEEEMCTDTPTDTVSVYLPFETRYNYDYIFKFYAGEDENGEDLFITDTIPVKG
ncbi:hypothetical protein [Leeuwenhoekiella nanhaiensis]|uniref:GOLD domain-containing protein n=1 Tax=Leeuwenhoekiella nanhaiensis TaxID=1655491 RepID=A0A2G1VVK4_9FLAO|nr:hypothetical protein [Leeuwenhoekiella nanhaiensis]PHQ30802.1 hypothetical protein CJ305_00810 [Leeuwenhoekiella nanhaiensis]